MLCLLFLLFKYELILSEVKSVIFIMYMYYYLCDCYVIYYMFYLSVLYIV